MATPKLRFKAFDGDWNESRLKDLAVKITDGTHDTPIVQKEGIPFLTAINVKDGFINYDDIGYVDEVTHKKIYERCNPEKDDLLIVNIGAGTATCARNIVDYQFSLKNVALVKPNRNLLNPIFLEQIQRKNSSKLFASLTSGGAQPFLSLKEIGKFVIKYPSLEEQTKIASFLSAVDEKISQLTQKHELLNQYKQGMMQKLFSQQIRFKADDGGEFGEWDNVKLKDILLSYRLGGNYSNAETITPYPLIKMGNLGRGSINLDKIEYIPEDQIIDPEDLIKKNDLFFNTRNTLDLVGKVALWRGELPIAYYNSNLLRLDFENNIFMNYLFNEQKTLEKLKAIASGTTSVAAIYTRDLLKIDLKVPCLEEQTKIANFLSSIDQKIEIVAQQIEHAKQWKKGLLQQMFV